MQVRAMLAGDLPAARSLWLATEGVGLAPDETPQVLERYLSRNPGISSVASEGGGALVGALLGGHDGRRGYLYHLAVSQPWRGLGIGKSLVQHATTELAGHGISRVTIFVYAHNPEGRAFWEHLGWKAREDLDVTQLAL
jgi:ribosomal protein S18 acetylase RimI-like enzyme